MTVVRTDRADDVEVARFDRAPVASASRTDEGFLVAPAQLTRTGVFEYRNPDGSVRRELRLEGDVFAPASLATYQARPIVRGHPDDLPHSLLTAETAAGRVVGAMSEVRRADDGRHVAATVTLYDAATIRAVDSGERELSVGYRARIEPIPGGVHRFSDGTEVRADFYQRNIRANHLAIVPRGRAGESASIRLDAAGHQVQESTMTPEQIAAMQAENARLKAEAEAHTKARTDSLSAAEKAQAEAATAKAAAAALQARLDEHDKAQAKAAHKAMCERVAPITGEKAEDLVRLDAAEVQRKALTKLIPTLDLTGKDATFLAPAFETAMSLVRTDSAAVIAGAVLLASPRNDTDPQAQLAKAREEARKAAADAHKTKA